MTQPTMVTVLGLCVHFSNSGGWPDSSSARFGPASGAPLVLRVRGGGGDPGKTARALGADLREHGHDVVVDNDHDDEHRVRELRTRAVPDPPRSTLRIPACTPGALRDGHARYTRGTLKAVAVGERPVRDYPRPPATCPTRRLRRLNHPSWDQPIYRTYGPKSQKSN